MGVVRLGVLADATAAEATALLTEADAPGLIAAVRSLPDAELQALIDRDEIRAAAVAALVGRVADFAVPRRLAGLRGTVLLELCHAGAVAERALLSITRHGIAAAPFPGADDPGAPVDPVDPVDVVLRTDVLGFVRLASGEHNAGLEYLGGRLAIEGDADLALGLGGIFPAAGSDPLDPVPVDPRALDPIDVARELGGVDAAHLRGVMASGFRDVVLAEVFSRLPDFVNARRSRGLRAVVGFRLTGRPDDTIDRYVVRLDRGIASTLSGAEADAVGRDDRSATVTCAAHDFLRLATGHLSPVTGVLRGQLKVRGDKAAALRLAGAFDIPSAAAG